MGEVKRLNVNSTVKNSGLYLAESLARVRDTETLENFEVMHVGGGLVVQGREREVVIDYRDLIVEVMKVL